MELEEAIDHAKQKAKELGDCECAKDHLQLAEWLEELKLMRSVNGACDFCKEKAKEYGAVKVICSHKY